MSGLAWITGRNSVLEALRAGRKIEKIYIASSPHGAALQEIMSLAKAAHIVVEERDRKALDRLVPQQRHQGVAAQAQPIAMTSWETCAATASRRGEVPFFVLLDGIEDVHNMGAIIRTAECAGAHAVLIPKRHSAPINETVGKTSAGAVEYMPLVSIGNTTQVLKALKKAGFWIIGADMNGEADYFHTDMTMPLVLVIGNEGKGISRLVKENCDILVQIPMFGHVNSLNASVAAALLIYETVRQRGIGTEK